jgi:hypothetical protein
MQVVISHMLLSRKSSQLQQTQAVTSIVCDTISDGQGHACRADSVDNNAWEQ